jgi:hypothetical protein
MARGLRSSRLKANNTKLRRDVFGPIENARIERLSKKLTDLSSTSTATPQLNVGNAEEAAAGTAKEEDFKDEGMWNVEELPLPNTFTNTSPPTRLPNTHPSPWATDAALQGSMKSKPALSPPDNHSLSLVYHDHINPQLRTQYASGLGIVFSIQFDQKQPNEAQEALRTPTTNNNNIAMELSEDSSDEDFFHVVGLSGADGPIIDSHSSSIHWWMDPALLPTAYPIS